MRQFWEGFEEGHAKCSDAFVRMGSGAGAKVEGHGTSRAKAGGRAVCLPGSLHIPSLGCDLFSATRRGRIGEGHSFLQPSREAHLIHPSFSITRGIPAGWHMKIELEPMSDDNWELPNCVCGGGSGSNCGFSNFEERPALASQTFNARHAGQPMAHAQRKKASDVAKPALGSQNTSVTAESKDELQNNPN